MYAQHTKQANIGKLLASLGLGGLIGGGIGRVSGYNAGNQAGYSEGSANASKDTLINLLKGMTGVVQQGAESKLDLKKLLDSKSGAMPSLPVAPINAASIKTARLRRVLYRVEKSAAEKQAIAALLKVLGQAGGKAISAPGKALGAFNRGGESVTAQIEKLLGSNYAANQTMRQADRFAAHAKGQRLPNWVLDPKNEMGSASPKPVSIRLSDFLR